MIAAAKVGDVPNFGKKVLNLAGQNVLLINVKGDFFAVENDCPHQGSPLTAAVVKEGYIACPRHGYRFSLSDGGCGEHPELRLRTFPVEVRGDDIFIELG